MNALTPDEVLIVQMALQQIIEDNEAVSTDSTLPFTPEARTMMRDMLKNAKSALVKIQKASGCAIQLDPYNEGDEKEFLTKES